MKVVVLGGCGAMGSATVADLVQWQELTELVIADLNIKQAEKLATELGSKKLSLSYVDATNPEALVPVIEGASAVANCTHQDCSVSVTKAAITAGVNLCDMGFRYDAALGMLEHDEDARKRGVTVLVSAGASPGTTNLLAKHLCTQMDVPETVNVSFASLRPISLSRSLVDVFLSEITTEGRKYENGKLLPTPPFSGHQFMTYPEPFGKLEMYNITHSEVVTLPRYIPELKSVKVKAAWRPEYMKLLRFLYEQGLLDNNSISVNGTSISPREFIGDYLFSKPPDDNQDVLYMHRVTVTGIKSGVKYEKTIDMPFISEAGARFNALARATGIPTSIIVQMLAKGEITSKGVMGPEACIDTSYYISELKSRAISVLEYELTKI